MKFADYFKEAIAYGKSLGLKQKTRASRKWWIELGSQKGYPVIYATNDLGICVNSGYIPAGQQVKLIKLFTSAYERYLADKKEPVAADSSK
jgi:hypothetical protein